MTIDFPIFSRTQTAESTPFDGASLGFTSRNLQDAIRELASSNFTQVNFEYLTLTAENIAEKQVALSKVPASGVISLDVIGGTTQLLGGDFVLLGRLANWDGLGLDGLLEEGDILRVMYPTESVAVEYHTFTAGEISAGEFRLEKPLFFADAIMLDIVGGCQQYPGLDFTVDGQNIVFKNFRLETLLEAGDIARIIYQSY